MAVRPYSWAALERVRRADLGLLARAQTAWASALDPERVAAELASLTGAAVDVEVTALRVGQPARRLQEITFKAGAATVTLGLEPDLGAELLSRVLGRPFALMEPGAALPPTLTGALAALVVEVARRVSSVPVALESGTALNGGLRADVVIKIEGRAFGAYALASGDANVPRGDAPPDLESLGDVPLPIPLVVGASLAARGDLERLVPGAAFLPSDTWVDARGCGRGVLVAATGSRGVWVELPPDGRIVLRDATAELPFDVAGPGDTMSDANDVNETLTDAALDAPVVVRVELGVVSLSARRWAELRPGDVLETGHPLGEPVVLRVAGRAVARGELLDVEGTVGVRVREVFDPSGER